MDQKSLHFVLAGSDNIADFLERHVLFVEVSRVKDAVVKTNDSDFVFNDCEIFLEKRFVFPVLSVSELLVLLNTAFVENFDQLPQITIFAVLQTLKERVLYNITKIERGVAQKQREHKFS